jgi:hypothetical protein
LTWQRCQFSVAIFPATAQKFPVPAKLFPFVLRSEFRAKSGKSLHEYGRARRHQTEFKEFPC